jgi:hypothetical protein
MTTENLLDVLPGTRLALLDGSEAEVIHNPADGAWLFCRYLSHPTMPSLVDGREHAVFVHDVDTILSPGVEAPKE